MSEMGMNLSEFYIFIHFSGIFVPKIGMKKFEKERKSELGTRSA
jgi:hypothetical protein